MSRKTASLTTAVLVLLALIGVAVAVPMPYVVMSPGGTENTLGSYKGTSIITIDGHKTFPTSGALDLTTVSVTSPDYSPRLPDVLRAWWSQDEIVLPREVVYPTGESVSQVNEQNQTDMLDSQSSAIAAGLGQAGIDAIAAKVESVTVGAPADGVLEAGDVILAVDGTTVANSAEAISAISSVPPESTVRLRIERGDDTRTVSIVTEKNPDDPTKSLIGAVLTDFAPPFDVTIDTGQDIGGPSAGMMFALGVYDKITPGSLTGGKHVAGTGTITTDGRVGPIGGIQQKIAGAVDSGATVFMAPAANCAEALGSQNLDNVELIKVTTLDSAVTSLNDLASGDTSDLPRCSS
jgi:PDZ domain-containing protein